MKVYLGPYTNWVGPYQIAEKLMFWKDRYHKDPSIAEKNREEVHNFGERLSRIPYLTEFCTWVYSKKKRKIDIHIDNYDVWSVDHTLALIIAPMLKRLKEQKMGSPHVDDEDVPEHLRSTAAPNLTEEEKNSGTTDYDYNWFKRWDYVLDEMIWAFEQHANENFEEQFYSGEVDMQFITKENGSTVLGPGPDHTFSVDQEAMDAAYKRMENGRRLFAKYYMSLWD